MKQSVIVLGAGGHGKVLIEALLSQSVDIIGITDPSEQKHKKCFLGVPVLGGDDEVLNYPPEKVLLVNGLGTMGTGDKRKELFCRFKEKGYSFATVVHASAVVSSDAKLLEGVQVMAGAVIQPGCQICEDTIINTNVSVDHDCSVGKHVHLAPGVTLAGNVHVEDEVFVGVGAVVIHGVCIGKNGFIGAGATVISDVPAKTRLTANL